MKSVSKHLREPEACGGNGTNVLRESSVKFAFLLWETKLTHSG